MKSVIVVALAFGVAATALQCSDDLTCEGCLTQPKDAEGNSGIACESSWGQKKCTRKGTVQKWNLKTLFCHVHLCTAKPCANGCVSEEDTTGVLQCKKTWNQKKCKFKGTMARYSHTEWCFPTPTTTAARSQCIQSKGTYEGRTGDFCQACCPSCTSVDMANFKGYFTGGGVPTSALYPAPPWLPPGYNAEDIDYSAWQPVDATTCVCLELAADGYNSKDPFAQNRPYIGPITEPYKGAIALTEHDDCVRVTGNANQIYALGGADAVYMNGNPGDNGINVVWGGDGDDHLTGPTVKQGLSYQLLFGADGTDTCTNSISSWAVFCETLV